MLPVSQDSWPPTGWLTRKEAAARLKLSDSRVAALGGGPDPKPGEIHTVTSKSPSSGQTCTLYHAGDVERIAFERENPAQASRGPVAMTSQGPFSTPAFSGMMKHVASQMIGDLNRGLIGEEHSTEHYRIKEWVKPSPESPHHQFVIEGPSGRDGIYVAVAEECGPSLIRGFERAYQHGMRDASPNAWLTIEQAEKRCGLPASIIQKLVESGKLPALDCGPRPGGRWRVKRSDLDALEGDR